MRACCSFSLGKYWSLTWRPGAFISNTMLCSWKEGPGKGHWVNDGADNLRRSLCVLGAWKVFLFFTPKLCDWGLQQCWHLSGKGGMTSTSHASPSVLALILFSCLSTIGDQERHEAKLPAGLIPRWISLSTKPYGDPFNKNLLEGGRLVALPSPITTDG